MDRQEMQKLLQKVIVENGEVNASVPLFFDWNDKHQFQTKAFEWFYLNITLIASLEDQSIEEVTLSELTKIDSFLDIMTFFKDECEKKDFQTFTKVTPLF
ncbi:hypothetical protein [Alkalihalobacillus pseudalcaliphilus]|uniref:hypothetical protein n=1 Tax=Alkalihalobacillus pseudalcaliphilus TaxID=79884 RepID=UPI00064DDFC2|nr:hypothetical protein [Alkalihalobacillus pseudalcaliphilus]KMK77918.1 hypothetical protein AB990_00165 [Alkalihalobacillus pseudalcaliphilus]